MRKEIEQQICSRWEYDEASKPQNQKLFPFSIHTNFSASRNYPQVYEPLKCGYCGEALCNDYGYYTAYIIFNSPEDVKICCYKCEAAKYTFTEQLHGYEQPLKMPEQFSGSLKHLVVARCFLGSRSIWYALNKYVATGVTWEQFYELCCSPTFSGGSHVYPQNGAPILCHWEWRGNRLTTEYGKGLSISKKEITDIVNQIIAANRPHHQAATQLSLF